MDDAIGLERRTVTVPPATLHGFVLADLAGFAR